MQAPDAFRFDAAGLSARMVVIFAALGNSVVIMGVALWFVAGGEGAEAPAWSSPLVQALAAGALGVLIAAKAVFGKMTAPDALLDVARRDGGQLAAKIQAALVTALALSESAALFGFVAGMLVKSWPAYIPFGAAALVSMALYFPSAGRLNALAEPALRRAGM
jgi:hypothetical protein